MTHLTREELETWRDRPDLSARDRIVAHLAACDACGAICAELVRTRPAEIAPARLNPGDFAPRAHSMHRPRAFRHSRLHALMWLGVAVLLAIVVLVPVLGDPEPGPDKAGVTRGGTIDQLEPSGDVGTAIDFTWRSSAPAYTYRLEVKDSRGVVLLSRTVASNGVEATPDVWRRFKDGERYTWTVTALDTSGEPMAASDPQAFTVRGPG